MNYTIANERVDREAQSAYERAFNLPFNANTVNTTALVKTLCRVGTDVLTSTLAPMNRYATVLEVQEPDKVALDSEVGIVTAVPEVQTDPTTTWENGDSTIDPVSLTHHLYVESFGLTFEDMASGARVAWLADLAARTLANKLADLAGAVFTVANFGAPIVSKDAADFAVADFETLVGGISSSRRAVILDTAWWSKVKADAWLPVGFNAVYEQNRWPAAEKVHGIVADPRAVVIRTGIPMLAGLSPAQRELIELPQIGIAIEATIWASLQTRGLRCAYATYFAAAKGDGNAAKLLCSVS